VKIDRTKLLERVKIAERESKYLDLKREFNVDSAEAWCSLIKDIVAFANSGGGIVVFGVEDNGSDSTIDTTAILKCDDADFTNKIAKYTNYQFSEIETVKALRGSKSYPAFLISGVEIPIVFTKPGTYDIGGGKQKTAFSQGTIYFRHGSKSEPANRDDLQSWRDREITRARKSWLGGIRKVVEIAPGQSVVVTTQVANRKPADPILRAVVTADPNAARFVPINAEEIWPYRQKDLIREVNKRLPRNTPINSHDIQSINRIFDILKSRPDFAYKSHTHVSLQYSAAYAEWIVQQFKKNKTIFVETRQKFRSLN